jgi:adenylosuccinate lyase
VAAGNAVKEHGARNDLIRRIAADPLFGLSEEELEAALDPKLYIGRAPEQVTEFLERDVYPRLRENAQLLDEKAPELKV